MGAPKLFHEALTAGRDTRLKTFPAGILVRMILDREISEALGTARSLRDEGFRGAALFEVLALLKSRTIRDIKTARKLCDQISHRDLYNIEGLALPTPKALFEAALWIVNYELSVIGRRQPYNPSLRIQLIATASSELSSAVLTRSQSELEEAMSMLVTSGLKPAEAQGFLARHLIEFGRIRQAFPIVTSAVEQGADLPLVRHAAHLLFDQIPLTKRVNILSYSNKNVRNFGISPIEGEGFILKEYTGAPIARNPLYEEPVALPSAVDLWPWVQDWEAKDAEGWFWERVKNSPVVEAGSQTRLKFGPP